MMPLLAMMLVNHPADRDRGREADGDGFGPVICHPYRRPTAAAAAMVSSGLWSMIESMSMAMGTQYDFIFVVLSITDP